MAQHQIIIGNREYRVWWNEGNFCTVDYRPINAKTGKPWQAARIIERFEGGRAVAKGMRCWLMTTNAARKTAEHRSQRTL